jgi:RNA polymerase sigma-70 factor (ECF subfamily)
MPGAPEREERYRRLVTADVYDALWRFACRLSATREDAEDLLQDTLARGFQRLHQLQDESLVKGWLFSIMRRLSADRVKRGQRNVQLVEQSATAGGRHEPGNPGVIRRAVMTLPAAQREAVELFHFADLSLRETAAALGVSENNVKQRLWRARQSLLEKLGASLQAGELEGMF